MIRRYLVAFVTFMVLFVASRTALAQARRTWVSGVGDDVNQCTRTAPCRTFAGALAKTAAGGEIDVLDPGGYGTVVITKSVTIDGTGTFAAVNGSGGAVGITIDDSATASPNTITVTLRGLSINGSGTTLGMSGIRVKAASKVQIEDCEISHHSSHGIDVNLSGGGAAGTPSIYVRNTIVRSNGGDGLSLLNANAIGVRATVVGSSFLHNASGINAKSNAAFYIFRSDLSMNSQTGLVVSAGSSGGAVRGSSFSSNVSGIALVAGTTRIGDCVITGNTNGVNFVGGTLASAGNSQLGGNTNEAVGGIIPPPEGQK